MMAKFVDDAFRLKHDPENLLAFPPMYTLQPVEETKQSQLGIWLKLITNWCHEKGIQTISLNEFVLFDNAEISRRLDEEGRRAVGEHLVSKGYGEWIDSNRNTMRVTWRTPDDWGRIVYKHFAENGLLGTIYTFYELHSGDVSEGTDFNGLDANTCLSAVEALVRAGKAQIFESDAETVDETGFKLL